MNIYNVRMRLLPFLWFSMKFGMINSFLVVCFYNGFKKIFKSENIYKIRAKILCNGYKTTFMEKCVTFTINIALTPTEKMVIFLRWLWGAPCG